MLGVETMGHMGRLSIQVGELLGYKGAHDSSSS